MVGNDSSCNLSVIALSEVVGFRSFVALHLTAAALAGEIKHLGNRNFFIATTKRICRPKRCIRSQFHFGLLRMLKAVSELGQIVILVASSAFENVQISPYLPVDFSP